MSTAAMVKPRQLSLLFTTSTVEVELDVDTAPAAQTPLPGPTAPPAPAPPLLQVPRPKTKLLEEALCRRFGPIRLRITDNRSTLLSTSMRRGARTARVHQLFLDADASLFDDIAAFLSSGDPRAGRRIDDFVAGRDHLLHHHVRELKDDAHVGEHHDLLALYLEMNGRYFAGAIRADITWGAASPLKRRSSITLGSYDDRASRIHVHPALDQAWVPRLAVARIVHHEMLHAKYPPRLGPDGRRIVHGGQFRREEATFEGAAEADVWFDLNLDRLLRYRPQKRSEDGPRRKR